MGRQLFRSLQELVGASACDDWLTQHRDSIGMRSTFDLECDDLRAHAGRVQMPSLADAA